MEVEIVRDAEIAFFERSIKYAALEAEGAYGKRLVAGLYQELAGGWKAGGSFGVDEVPLFDRGGVGTLGGDQCQLEDVWGEDL